MAKFIAIKKSQIFHYVETPLYIKNDKGKYVLYKSEDTEIHPNSFKGEVLPDFYIPEHMRRSAYRELRSQLKGKLKQRIKTGDMLSIKSALCDIVDETFREPLDDKLETLPETLDIIYLEF